MFDGNIISAIHDVGLEVRNFKKNRNGSFAWSCEVCGDSATDHRKARFGVANKDGVYVVHCFNCGYSNTFTSYLKDFHFNIYQRLNVEKFFDKTPTLYDLNSLFKKVNEKTLINIFFVSKFRQPSLWLNYLEHKNIKLNKNNMVTLAKLHKTYWSNK